jgi:inositol hexakisphosphate/diphosphoinositol-pentakisphosphate kinase
MKTAAAFAKGLLELEGEIPPILVSLVHKEKGSMHMLDPSGDKDVKLELDECKEKLSKNLQQDIDWRAMTEEDRFRLVGPPQVTSLRDALAKIGNPRKTLKMIYETMGTLLEELEEMLMGYGSGEEKAAVEPGGIPKGDSEEDGGNDAALSGVKLYKGETLLELTERWRFIYKRLYDKETDTFDLTRIPDVLDNVRFDVLHNPHLGLTATLHKLYSNAKDMADTVVPQEYGTTIAQKRIVGIKVCSSLLDKIRFDLHIARTDNKTDMRYMINMDYSADLPINTMGRRIRTRLYFTSESHLHTLINVLRFAAEGDSCKYGDSFTSPVLSPSGMELLNQSKEVCYLTHFVIRLFEDTGRKISDTRRFRVEILFSAGATGTPIHQAQSTKGADLTRLDTEPLVSVGRDGLTCADVEDFFSSVINEGGEGDDHYDEASTSTAAEMMTAMKSKKKTPAPNSDECKTSTSIVDNTTSNVSTTTTSTDMKKDDAQVGSSTNAPSVEQQQTIVNERELDSRFSLESTATMRTANKSTSKQIKESVTDLFTANNANTVSENKEEEKDHDVDVDNGDVEDEDDDDDDDSNNKAVRDISHKYFYLTIATGTLLLGAGCLVMAMGLTKGTYTRRHYSRR